MSYETINSSIPDEPPVGSIVRGKSGNAWQSYEGSDRATFWACTKPAHDGGYRIGQKWGYLVIEEAPLTVLWRNAENV